MNYTYLTLRLIITLVMIAGSVAPQTKSPVQGQNTRKENIEKPLVTFVELGSVKCIPCRQMQPVMAAIEKKYAGQIKVVFYDVWKPEQQQYAEHYDIKLIPTQVFLDKDGKEFFRHEGFYPEAEIDKLLQKRGMKARAGE